MEKEEVKTVHQRPKRLLFRTGATVKQMLTVNLIFFAIFLLLAIVLKKLLGATP